MVRTVWFGLVCLIGLGAMASLRVAITPTVSAGNSLGQPTIGTAFEQNPLGKADKLKVSYIEEAPEKKLVTSIAVVPPKSAVKPKEKVIKIISRHWRDP